MIQLRREDWARLGCRQPRRAVTKRARPGEEEPAACNRGAGIGRLNERGTLQGLELVEDPFARRNRLRSPGGSVTPTRQSKPQRRPNKAINSLARLRGRRLDRERERRRTREARGLVITNDGGGGGRGEQGAEGRPDRLPARLVQDPRALLAEVQGGPRQGPHRQGAERHGGRLILEGERGAAADRVLQGCRAPGGACADASRHPANDRRPVPHFSSPVRPDPAQTTSQNRLHPRSPPSRPSRPSRDREPS